MGAGARTFFQRRIYGVVYIPENTNGVCWTVSRPTWAILRRCQLFSDVSAGLSGAGFDHRPDCATVGLQRLIARGTELPQAEATVQPVVYQSHNLFNPYLGYGSFAHAGHHHRDYPANAAYRYRDDRRHVAGTRTLSAAMSGRSATDVDFADYCWAGFDLSVDLRGDGLLYSRRALQVVPLSDNGTTGVVVVFMAVYLSAAIALSLAVSTLFRTRESSLLLLLWTSIPVLMLSGVSFPREGMPDLLYQAGQLLPSSSAVDGFIRIRSMGATLVDVLPGNP